MPSSFLTGFTFFFLSQGNLPWTGSDYKRIHARSDNHWSEVASGICSSFL